MPPFCAAIDTSDRFAFDCFPVTASSLSVLQPPRNYTDFAYVMGVAFKHMFALSDFKFRLSSVI